MHKFSNIYSTHLTVDAHIFFWMFARQCTLFSVWLVCMLHYSKSSPNSLGYNAMHKMWPLREAQPWAAHPEPPGPPIWLDEPPGSFSRASTPIWASTRPTFVCLPRQQPFIGYAGRLLITAVCCSGSLAEESVSRTWEHFCFHAHIHQWLVFRGISFLIPELTNSHHD